MTRLIAAKEIQFNLCLSRLSSAFRSLSFLIRACSVLKSTFSITVADGIYRERERKRSFRGFCWPTDVLSLVPLAFLPSGICHFHSLRFLFFLISFFLVFPFGFFCFVFRDRKNAGQTDLRYESSPYY
jgi:hypothetical protein